MSKTSLALLVGNTPLLQVGTMYRVDIYGKHGVFRSIFYDRQAAISYAQMYAKKNRAPFITVLDKDEKIIYQEKSIGKD